MSIILKYLITLSLNSSFEGKKILDSTTDLSFLILRLKQSLKEEEIFSKLDSKSNDWRSVFLWKIPKSAWKLCKDILTGKLFKY